MHNHSAFPPAPKLPLPAPPRHVQFGTANPTTAIGRCRIAPRQPPSRPLPPTPKQRRPADAARDAFLRKLPASPTDPYAPLSDISESAEYHLVADSNNNSQADFFSFVKDPPLHPPTVEATDDDDDDDDDDEAQHIYVPYCGSVIDTFEAELIRLQAELALASRPLPASPKTPKVDKIIISIHPAIAPEHAIAPAHKPPAPRSEGLFRFGKRNGLSNRRPTDCICLQESEMIVIDYPDAGQSAEGPSPAIRSLRRPAPPPPAPSAPQPTDLPPPVPPRPPRQPAPPRPQRGLPRSYPMDFPIDVPSTSYPTNTTQVYVNGAAGNDDDTLVRVKHRREKSGSMCSLGSAGRQHRIRSTASSSTTDGDELWTAGSGDPAEPADASEDEDDESVPSADGFHELKDCVRECLEKEPNERCPEDVAVLLDFMQHMSAFASLPVSIKRQLCLKMVFAVVPDAGTVVMQNDEKIDAWAVIVNGCVEVVKSNGERHEYKLGDSFGCKAINAVQYHEGDMRTVVDDCEFVLVEHRDFCSIMSTIGEHIEKGRDEVTGEVVSETERRNVGAQEVLVLIKAKPDKLVSHLVVERDDQKYVDDFLLTYRVYIDDPVRIFEKLMHWFAEPQYRDQVARIVLLWANNHYNDFETNPELMALLERFEQALERDQMHSQQIMLQIACSVKSCMRTLHFVRARKDEPLQFTVMGGAELGQSIFVTDVIPDSEAANVGLKPADELLEVNNRSFKCIALRQAIDILKDNLSITMVVKNNILGFKELVNRSDKPDGMRPKAQSAAAAQARSSMPNVIPIKGAPSANSSAASKSRMNGKSMMDKLFTMIRNPRDGDVVDAAENLEQMRVSKSHPDLALISQYYGPVKSDSPEHVLKIYRADQTFKFLPVFKETTAQNVVQLALQEFNMTAEGSLEWALCEVTVTDSALSENGTKNPPVIKQSRLPPQMENLAERISLNSRYYLKNNSRSETLVPDELAPEILKEAEAQLLQLNAQDVAAQLTLQDFAVFASIESTEYIDSLFKLDSRYGWPRLDEFERVFNREMWWVATEICRERNTQRRAKLIKQFIKIARYCRDLHNFNSMFAIVSGLNKPAVRRLTSTWDRVSSKYHNCIKDIEALLNPSRNMSRYRTHLQHCALEPPVIPIFPIIKKDLTFLHEGNETYSQKLVNFDKLRMIAREVRKVNEYSSAPYEIGSMAEKSGTSVNDALYYMNTFDGRAGVATMRKGRQSQPRKKSYEQALMVRKVKAYLSGLDVVDCEEKLYSLSLEAEPVSSSQRTTKRAPSPTPSSVSSHSAGSEQKRVLGTKFGIDSPQAVQKMLALVQNSRVKTPSGQPSPASSARSVATRQPLSARSSAGSGMLRMSRASLASSNAENGLSSSTPPQRAVDLNRETSAVTNVYDSNAALRFRMQPSIMTAVGTLIPNQRLSIPARSQTPSPSPSAPRRPLSHPTPPQSFSPALLVHRHRPLPVGLMQHFRQPRMRIINESSDNHISHV